MYYLKSIAISIVSIIVVLKILSFPIILILGYPFDWIITKRISDHMQLVKYRTLYSGVIMALLLGVVHAICYRYFGINIYILQISALVFYIYPALSGSLNVYRIIEFSSEEDRIKYYRIYSSVGLLTYLFGLFGLRLFFDYVC